MGAIAPRTQEVSRRAGNATLLARSYGSRRASVTQRRPRLDLHEDQRIVLPGDDIDLAAGTPKAPFHDDTAVCLQMPHRQLLGSGAERLSPPGTDAARGTTLIHAGMGRTRMYAFRRHHKMQRTSDLSTLLGANGHRTGCPRPPRHALGGGRAARRQPRNHVRRAPSAARQ